MGKGDNYRPVKRKDFNEGHDTTFRPDGPKAKDIDLEPLRPAPSRWGNKYLQKQKENTKRKPK